MKEQTARWIKQAEYDFETAEAMMQTRRYVYVVFTCHLSLGKMLKAAYTEASADYPPHIHSLTKLATKAGVVFPDDMKDFIHSMSNMSIPTRYDDEVRNIGRAEAQRILSRTRKAFKWLRRRLKSGD